jgi:hypothetical protein
MSNYAERTEAVRVSERTSGKLVIKAFVNHSTDDSHGRRSGRWVTLFTEHGLDKERAQEVARDFAINNPTFTTMSSQLHAQFLPYPQHIYT